MSKGKVLVIGSNATRIEVRGGGTGATGQYLNETVVPAMALVDAGYEVVLATPSGAKPHIDKASESAQHFGGDEVAYQQARTFFADHPSMNTGRTLRSVIDEGLEQVRRCVRARRPGTRRRSHAGFRGWRDPATLPHPQEADGISVPRPDGHGRSDAQGTGVSRGPDRR